MTITLLGLFISLGLLACGTVAMLRTPLSRYALDAPNERSAHTNPTPRGGGCAIWLAYSVGLVILALLGHIEIITLIAFLGSGSLAMLSGLLDDFNKHGVKAETRLVLHVIAVVWAILWLGGIKQIQIGSIVWQWGYAEQILLALAMLWIINITNFMDGLNGLAASEIIFVSGTAGMLAWASGDTVNLLLCALLLATTTGFLPWNIRQAKIFLGDSGAYFLGMTIALLALTSAQTGSVPPWCWMILFAVFLGDSAVAKIRRMAENIKAWKEPHDTHAYNHLSRYWNSHGKVSLAICAVNILLLAPLAILAWAYPYWGVAIAFITLSAMILLATLLGSGVKRVHPSRCG